MVALTVLGTPAVSRTQAMTSLEEVQPQENVLEDLPENFSAKKNFTFELETSDVIKKTIYF